MNELDRAVEAFVAIRDRRDADAKAAKERKADFDGKLDELAAYIGKQMGDGVDSIKTKHGTAFRATKDFTSVTDFTKVIAHVKLTDDFQLFNKSVSKTAVKEYMEEHSGIAPPGIEYGTKVEIQVRRPIK